MGGVAPQVLKCILEDTRKGTLDGPANWATLTIPRILERHGLKMPLEKIPTKKGMEENGAQGSHRDRPSTPNKT